jgi:hypothetical protein
MPIPILTARLTSIPENEKYEELGTVIGYDRERISFLRRLGDSFMSFFGGSDGLIRKKVNDCIDNAKKDIRKKAVAEFGSDVTHIYQAEFNMSTFSSIWDYLECQIQGVAVKKLPPSENKKKSSKRNTRKNILNNRRSSVKHIIIPNNSNIFNRNH